MRFFITLVTTAAALKTFKAPERTEVYVRTRRSVLISLASASASRVVAAEVPEKLDPQAAADLIRNQGILQSTGKRFPPSLLGAIAFGGAAAAASYAFQGQTTSNVSSVVQNGRYSEEEMRERFEAYEKSKWTNNVKLPWMPDELSAQTTSDTESPAESEHAESES